jgi:hypothetical protein
MVDLRVGMERQVRSRQVVKIMTGEGSGEFGERMRRFNDESWKVNAVFT